MEGSGRRQKAGEMLLHLVINDRGELLAVRLTPGNTDERAPVPALTRALRGQMFGDGGYISRPAAELYLLRSYVEHTLRTAQELWGHSDVTTTMIYTRVLQRRAMGVRSPPEIGETS